MSQFEFPRIHFSGQTTIDPATGNNNYHFPLVTYEPVTATVVLPPRIYLDDHLDLSMELRREGIDKFLMQDQDGSSYIEIEPINSPDLFKSWNTTPLGDHAADVEFHKLYELIVTKNERTPLKGKYPGHWNYFGTMNFCFDQVHVHSVQVLTEGVVTTYSQESQPPAEIASLIGAELSFNDHRGRNSAIMIDVSPTFSIYTQVFCDRVLLKKGEEIILDGRPLKASMRQINAHRIINDSSITGASGTFYTTIGISQLQEARDSPIIRFFESMGVKGELMAGVFIRYDLFEVSGIATPDYDDLGAAPNPATSTVLGCISPWFKGEMATAPPGRLLVPHTAFSEKKELGSLVGYFNHGHRLLSLDFVGSLPEIKKAVDPAFEIYNLGTIEVCLTNESQKKEIKIGSWVVGGAGINRSEYIRCGGLMDIPVKDWPEVEQLLVHGGELRLYLADPASTNSEPQRVLLSKENTYRIITDQTGLYCDENDPPEEGYLSNGSHREHCVIRVFKHGRPVKGTIPATVFELAIKPFSSGEQLTVLDQFDELFDGQKFIPSTGEAGHKFFAFYPREAGILPGDIKHYMLISGAFVNMRILPHFSPSNYSVIQGQKQRAALSFEVIFREMLLHYDLIYPASGIITPFEAGHLKKIQAYVKELMDLSNWHKFHFMPSSRDLPKGKRDLLFKWLQNETNRG